MSTKSQSKIDAVDRVRIGWIINLILNHKTQEEIAKDIADGILNFEEIEEMFPWRYVQELRRGNLESTQNFLYRFTQISDDRMKVILDKFLRQKSRNEIIKLISDHALKLDKLQVSYLWKYVIENKENVNSEATSSTSLMSPNEHVVIEGKESSNMGTKKKQTTKKSDMKETKKSKKKETKKSDEEETKKSGKEEAEKKVEKPKKVRIVTKKVADVESKNVKRVDSNVDDRNEIEEAIEENNSAKGDLGYVEKASIDLGVSTNQESQQEGLKELSETCQGDRSKDEKSTGAKKKIGKKVSKKNTKASMEKISERDSKEMNFPIEGTSSTNEEQRVEENNKSESNQNVIEKEEASFAKTNDSIISLEIREDERFEEDLQKSRSNETVNISSLIGEEQEICDNQNQKDRDVQEYDLNIQLDASTPKKLDNDGNIIQVKEELEDERSPNEIDYSTNNDLEKDADSEKNFNKTSQVINDEEVSNLRNPIKSIIVKPENVTRSPESSKPAKHNPTKKEAKSKVQQSKHKKQTDRSLERQNQSKRKRLKEKELRKCEKKIQNTMEGLKDQINKLVKDIRYLGEENRSSSSTDDSSEKESSSSPDEYTSEEEYSGSSDDYYTSEEESSYELSSESSSKLVLETSEECSCPSCMSSKYNSSTSNSDSEYTICSCSNHYSSTESDDS
ncbi:hypothetical protein HZH68_010987 [Vespula germanica]|uniref:Uncharacterized protein n=1 Tax=Vespula germanica TaxID=30212 RepID=A0A834N1D7_VESGE|nr:hypothetical protein HZH68_010987 [Vespula germanica]